MEEKEPLYVLVTIIHNDQVVQHKLDSFMATHEDSISLKHAIEDDIDTLRKFST